MTKTRYIQIADKLSDAIKKGELPPGTKLPTHRAFAEKFGIALGTATRVYRELEHRGIIVGEAGRGTFVRDQGLSMTHGLLQTSPDGLVDLVFNMPGETADAELLRSGLRRLATSGDLQAMMRYQPHAGRRHERRIIAERLGANHGPIDPDHLLITSGGQHGLAIGILGLFQRGDSIAVDALTYPGFKSAASLQGINLVPVQSVAGVMDPDALEAACRLNRLRAVYLMPTVQNPLGSVMDAGTRRRIVELAQTYDLTILEDAAYAFLEPDPPPSFLTLAPARTLHIGGFSKNLATGLRLGYLITPEKHLDALSGIIRATTWNTPALIVDLVTNWIDDGTLDRMEQSRREDGAARQKICREVFADLPIAAHPNAGFAWLPLAKGARSSAIISTLKDQGLSVSGAEPFATTTAVPQALRLAFGGVPKTDLKAVLDIVRDAVVASL